MNEHYFQKKFKQILGMIGYVMGICIFALSIIGIVNDLNKWTTFATIGTLGLILSYLSDIILSSNARTELMLRIMKRQEVLFRRMNQPNESEILSDPLGLLKNIFGNRDNNENLSIKEMKISLDENGKMKIKGDEPPEEMMEVLKKITEAMKNAFEQEVGKSLEDMSNDELQEELKKCIKQEDYQKAGMLRDEIKKRNIDNSPED